MTRLRVLLATALVSTSSACTVLLPVDAVQCRQDSDCAFASATAAHVCREEVCVPDVVTFPVVIDRYYAPEVRIGDGTVVASTDCPMRAGEARGDCHRFVIEAASGEDGAAWIRPADASPIAMPEGAVAVSFQAWSESEDLSIRFGAARTDAGPAASSGPLLVDDRPRQFFVDLRGLEQSSPEMPFEWLLRREADAEPTAFFIDDLVWLDTLPPGQMRASQRVYASGVPPLVSFAFGSTNARDWLGMYVWNEMYGADDGTTSEDYEYTNGASSGTIELMPAGPTYVVPELYKVGYWANDIWDVELAPPIYLFIGEQPTLAVEVTGGTARVSYANAPGLTQDAIQLFEGSVDGEDTPRESQLTVGASGEVSFTGLPPGSYSVSYLVHQSTGFEATRRLRFVVENEIE